MIIKRNIKDRFKSDDEYKKYVEKMKSDIAESFVIVHKDKLEQQQKEEEEEEN